MLTLLAIVVGLLWIAQRFGFAPSTALLVGGSALAFVPGLPVIALDPEFVLEDGGKILPRLLGAPRRGLLP